MKAKSSRYDRLRVGLIKQIVRTNIKEGKMTFGQRIELGKIMTSNEDVIIKAIKIMYCLHGFRPTMRQLGKLSEYITEIIEGLKYWANAESIMLKYDPTPEEKQAGINDLSNKIGNLGTIDTIAEKYGCDPDLVNNWQYAKVFGILYADLERAKYQRKYQTIVAKKKK